MLFRTSDEIEDILEICKNYNVTPQDGMYKRTPQEVKEIIDICIEKGIKVKSSIFRKKPLDFKKVVDTCIKLDIPPTGSVYRRTVEEIEEIYKIHMDLLNSKPTPNTFNKKPSEVEKIIKLCLENDINITGTIYCKDAYELEDTINYIKNNFGKEYLIPQVIIEAKEHLQIIMTY